MRYRVVIAVEKGLEPLPGESFVISLQEDSEILGIIDNRRAFRFKSATNTERDFQKENKPLTVLAFRPISARGDQDYVEAELEYSD